MLQPVKQFSLGIDWFQIKLTDIIATPSTQEVVSGNATGNPAYANSVVRDANNNTVDEVRWYDFGHWDKWADGLGSSLELIDPDQAQGRTHEVFERVKAYYKMAPGLQRALNYLPETTDAL